MFPHMPYDEAHQLLLMAGRLYADPDWTYKEHQELWEEFYPPRNQKADTVIYITCLGKKVPEDLIEEARSANQNRSQNL